MKIKILEKSKTVALKDPAITVLSGHRGVYIKHHKSILQEDHSPSASLAHKIALTFLGFIILLQIVAAFLNVKTAHAAMDPGIMQSQIQSQVQGNTKVAPSAPEELRAPALITQGGQRLSSALSDSEDPAKADVSWDIFGYTWGRNVSGEVRKLVEDIADTLGPNYQLSIVSRDLERPKRGDRTCEHVSIQATFRGDFRFQAEPGQLHSFTATVNSKGNVIYKTSDPATGKRIMAPYAGKYPEQEPEFSSRYFSTERDRDGNLMTFRGNVVYSRTLYHELSAIAPQHKKNPLEMACEVNYLTQYKSQATDSTDQRQDFVVKFDHQGIIHTSLFRSSISGPAEGVLSGSSCDPQASSKCRGVE